VVPTFNRPQQLADCLDALSAQTLPKECFEVIVVDDGGSHPLTGITESFAGRLHIKFLRQANGGCASARQCGIDNAEGEYLAFTDDDCRPAPDWLTRIEAVLKRNPDCAVAGRTINGLRDDLYAEATQSIVEALVTSGRDRAGYVRYAPTHNLAFRKAPLMAIGALDRSWRIAGGEDRDLCARWSQGGFRLAYESLATVLHYHRLNLRGFLRQHFHYGRGAWRYYTNKASFPRFESPRLYSSLLLTPFREQPIGRALAVCGLVLLAQSATGVGLLVQAVRRGPVARKPASLQDSNREGANSLKDAS
jgi:glycosyltransferase involved in cell wall biosynthesis